MKIHSYNCLSSNQANKKYRYVNNIKKDTVSFNGNKPKNPTERQITLLQMQFNSEELRQFFETYIFEDFCEETQGLNGLGNYRDRRFRLESSNPEEEINAIYRYGNNYQFDSTNFRVILKHILTMVPDNLKIKSERDPSGFEVSENIKDELISILKGSESWKQVKYGIKHSTILNPNNEESAGFNITRLIHKIRILIKGNIKKPNITHKTRYNDKLDQAKSQDKTGNNLP